MFGELVSTPTGAFVESLSRALESRIPRHLSKSTVYTREHLLLRIDAIDGGPRSCMREGEREGERGGERELEKKGGEARNRERRKRERWKG